MLTRQSTLALVGAVSLGAAMASVQAQSTKKAQAKDTGNMVAASVNGEKITRATVIDLLLADQAEKLKATDPIFQDRQRLMAACVGSLTVKKLAGANYQPVTISRAEIIDYAFSDKPDIIVKTVERIITERAVAQEAKKQGITITAAEIAEQTTKALKTAKQNFRKDKMSDADLLKAMGFRANYLKPFVETQLFLEKMVLKDIAAKIGHPMGVDDYVSASHILIKAEAPQAAPDPQGAPKPEQKPDTEKAFAEAKKKIDAILDDIKSGKITFEKAAKEKSDDGSKMREGSLGVFPRGQMVPEFEKAVFTQKKGEIGQPVRSQFGWHIIRVDKTGKELTGPERAAALETITRQKVGQKVQEIMAKAKIVNNAAPAASANPMMMPGGQ